MDFPRLICFDANLTAKLESLDFLGYESFDFTAIGTALHLSFSPQYPHPVPSSLTAMPRVREMNPRHLLAQHFRPLSRHASIGLHQRPPPKASTIGLLHCMSSHYSITSVIIENRKPGLPAGRSPVIGQMLDRIYFLQRFLHAHVHS